MKIIKKQLITTFILLFFVYTEISCKRDKTSNSKKEKGIIGPKSEKPDDKLFQDQAAFCEGCYSVAQELHKLLKKWNKEPGSLENHVDAAFLSLCSNERLRAYVLSPPKMTRLCSGILAHYNDDIALAIMEVYGTKTKPTADQLFQAICVKATPSCPKKMKPMTVLRNEARDKDESDPVVGGQVIKGGEQVEITLDEEGNTKATTKKGDKTKPSDKKSKAKKSSKKKENVKDEL